MNQIRIRLRHIANAMAMLVGLFLAAQTATTADELDLAFVGRWPNPPFYHGDGVAIAGRHAFVADLHGVFAFDLGNPVSFPMLGSLATAAGTHQIAMVGNHAFVTDYVGRMLVFDCSEPARLRLVTVLDTDGRIQSMAVHGSHAYLYVHPEVPTDDRKAALWIVDISDPTLPRAVATYPVADTIAAVAADGDLVCVASEALGEEGFAANLEAIDVHVPSSPRRIGIHQLPGHRVFTLTVANGCAYFAPYSLDGNGTRYSTVQFIDFNDSAGPKLLGTYSTTGEVRGLGLVGHHLYVGKEVVISQDLRIAMDILDVSDPGAPVRVGGFTSTAVDSDPSGITVGEGLAGIRSNNGLTMFDVSQPAVMRRLGTLKPDSATATRDVAVSGSHAVVATLGEVQILDVSNPAAPRRIGHYPIPGIAFRVVRSHDHAYVAADGLGLNTIDVSDPANPRLTSLYKKSLSDLALADHFLYGVGYGEELHVLDLTDPATPQEVGTIGLRYRNSEPSVAVSGTAVYVTSYDNPSKTGVVEVFDISNPYSPQWIGVYETPWRARHVAVSDNVAVVTGQREDDTMVVEILDASEPAHLRWLASYSPQEATWGGTVAIFGTRAYLGRSGSLEVLDLSQPSAPKRVGGLNAAGVRFTISGDLVFAAAQSSGVNILRMSTQALDLAGPFDLGGAASGVAIQGSTAFVAAGEAGLQLLDLRNVEQPSVLGELVTDDRAWDVAVADGRAYVAAGAAGLVIADVSTPSSPLPLVVFDTPGEAHAVLVSANVAYVADGLEGVHIVDVTEPTLPRRVGGHDTTGSAIGLAKYGNDLLVACNEAGLMRLDVSNLTEPRLVSTYNRGGNILAVAVSDHHALVADGVEGLVVLDLTHPSEFKVVGSAPGRAHARDIAVSGAFAYLADAGSGIQVYDLANFTHPRRLGGNAAIEAHRLVVSGRHLVIAAGQQGLATLPLFTAPSRLRALPGDEPGSVRVIVEGPMGARRRLQRSSDLRTWQDWQTVTLEGTQLTIPVPAEGAWGFFRSEALE